MVHHPPDATRGDPGPPAVGAADADPRFPAPSLGWREAIDTFDDSEWVGKAFGESLKRVFVATKRQEFDRMLARIPQDELEAYLDVP